MSELSLTVGEGASLLELALSVLLKVSAESSLESSLVVATLVTASASVATSATEPASSAGAVVLLLSTELLIAALSVGIHSKAWLPHISTSHHGWHSVSYRSNQSITLWINLPIYYPSLSYLPI